MRILTAILVTFLLFGSIWAGLVHSKEPPLAKVVFYVGRYDVGQAALEGLKGVREVKRGFRGFREINTVIYDPRKITPDEMVSALKAASTYRGTAESKVKR